MSGYADRYLAALAKIERLVKRRAKAGADASFARAVDLLARTDPLIERHSDDLKEYAQLRNAIVHDGTGKRLARPYAGTVIDIERLSVLLSQPPVIVDALGPKTVQYVNAQSPIRDAMRVMYEYAFSQMPAYDHGSLVDVLTSETLVRWLARSKREQPDLDAPVGDALRAVEDIEHFRVVSGTETAAAVLALFRDFELRGKYLDAVVVTQTGSREELPLNIATLFDMPKLMLMA